MACSKGYRLPEGGYRPKSLNFKMSENPYKLEKTSSIDTNKIYLIKEINTLPDIFNGDTLFTFYRFFSNGKVYYSNQISDRFPNNEEVNNLKKGLIGYYYIVNDEITTEIFVPFNFGQYKIEQGIIQGDTIIFYKEKQSLFSTYTSIAFH